VCGFVFAIACDHTPSSPADTATDAGLPDTLTEQTMPQLVANAICNKVIACGCDWLQSGPCYNDNACSFDACMAKYTQDYAMVDDLSSLFQIGYVTSGAQQCIDAINAASCSDVNWSALCSVIWQGTIEVGQACAYDRSCISGDAMTVGCVDATCAVVDALSDVDAAVDSSPLPICN
jgi:hypothetical protein